MIQNPLILTLDMGTTFIKASIFDSDLQIHHAARQKLDIISSEPTHQEQDPEQVMNATFQVFQEVVQKAGEEHIRAVCFSNAMHSIFPVDIEDRPLMNALIWSDLRASNLVNKWRGTPIGNDIHKETGTPLHAMSPLFKIMWLYTNEPEICDQARRFISLKEFIIKKWFGEYLVDFSTASASGLFNMHTLTWSEKALDLAQIDQQLLSTPIPVRTNLNTNGGATILSRIGLNRDTPIYIGGTDGCLAELAFAGNKSSGVSLTIGTSAAVRTCVTKPKIDHKGRIFNYVFEPDVIITGVPSNNGGNTIEWIVNLLHINDLNNNISTFTSIVENAIETIEAGCDGLFFIPYIHGERGPIWNSDATGSFVGINKNHTPDHFIKATVEGVLMNMRTNLELLPEHSRSTTNVSGGVFALAGLSQMAADILNVVIHEYENIELSSQGAAILALDELNEPIPDLPVIKTLKPSEGIVDFYHRHYAYFKEIVDKGT